MRVINELLKFLWIVCLIVFFLIMKTSKTQKRNKRLLVFYLIVCVVGIASLILGGSKYFTTYSTLEAAYTAYNGGMVFEIIEGENSALIVGSEGDLYAKKIEDGWKLHWSSKHKVIKLYQEENLSFVINQYDEKDYYVNIWDKQGGKMEIADNYDTVFECRSKGYGHYEYYGYVQNMNADYVLIIDEKEYPLNAE